MLVFANSNFTIQFCELKQIRNYHLLFVFYRKKPSKVVSTSETEESISRVTRPKRNRVTTSEATSESEDTAASPVKRSKKKLVISSEEESEIEQKVCIIL